MQLHVLLFQLALQPGVGLGLRYNMPPGLSVPCSISPFVYTHLSQVHGHVIHPSHSWSSSSSCCIQLPVQHLFFGISVPCILSICPSHLILWHLINLTMFSPLIMASNSSFCRVLHNSFSFTGYASTCIPDFLLHFPALKPLNAELNPICHLLALLGAHPILHISRIRVNIVAPQVAVFRNPTCASIHFHVSLNPFVSPVIIYQYMYLSLWSYWIPREVRSFKRSRTRDLVVIVLPAVTLGRIICVQTGASQVGFISYPHATRRGR